MTKMGKRTPHSSNLYEADKVDLEVGLSNGTSLRKLVPLRYRKVIKKCLGSVVFVIVFWSIAAFFSYKYLQSLDNPEMLRYVWGACVALLPLGLIWATGAQLLYYMRYFYDIDERTVIIRKGIIAKSEITLPFSKITDVYVNQDLLDVLFGLYDLHISTPTQSSGHFAHIDGLDKRGAYLIRSLVLERIHHQDEVEQNE